MSARDVWRAGLGMETGGPGWHAQGPPAPLSPAAELALLAIREMRRELSTDLATLNLEIGRALKVPDSLEARQTAYRAAVPTPYDLATRRLRHRQRVA